MDSSGFSTRLDRLVGDAGERAVKTGRQILVSLSERVTLRDSLSALEACRRSISLPMQLADHVSLGMAYWAQPSQGFAIAALGAAAVLSPNGGTDRFASVDEEWRQLLSNALVESDAPELPTVGPTLIGGFSFDPVGPLTTRWREFHAAHMIVPRFHLTTLADHTWLTISAIVNESGKPDLDVEAVPDVRDFLLSAELPRSENEGSLVEVGDDLSATDWKQLVADAVQEIRTRDLRKVVLARSVHGNTSEPINPFAVLRHLSSVHRDALIYGYWRDEKVFVGASPERLVKLEHGRLSASSLAGTAKRGATPEEDAALAQDLQMSAKDLGEHSAVREMLEEVLSEIGDNVSTSDRPEILTLSNVHHLHTEVTADLRDGYSLLDVVSRLHPTPAVGGSPREAALEFIRNKEQLDRGWYAAPVGWLDRNGGEFAVALRSGIIEGTTFALYAGCGIVADSDPVEELAESRLKLEPMRSAIAGSFEAFDEEMVMAEETE